MTALKATELATLNSEFYVTWILPNKENRPCKTKDKSTSGC